MGGELIWPLSCRTGTLTVSRGLSPPRLRNGVKYCKVLRLPEVSGAAPATPAFQGLSTLTVVACRGKPDPP